MKERRRRGEGHAVLRTLVFAALLILCACCSAAALAGPTGINAYVENQVCPIYEDGDWWYVFYENEVMLYSYEGSETAIAFPTEIEGNTVDSIYAAVELGNVVSVEIPGSLPVDKMFFMLHRQLETVIFGDGWEAIPSELLDNASGLKRVVFPPSLKRIENDAFRSCTSLTDVIFTEGLSYIGDSAFISCGLSDVVIPKADQLIIGDFAFSANPQLQRVLLGNGVTQVSQYAFSECPSLTEVTMTEIVSVGEKAFYECENLTSLDLGARLVTLGEDAFYGTAFTTIVLPDTLRTIGMFALYSEALETIDIPDTVQSMDAPIVKISTTQIVGENSAAHQAILRADFSNFRIRGAEDAPQIIVNAETAEEAASQIIAAVIHEGMTDYEKALALHDYLTWHAQYDVTHSTPNRFKAEGILLYGVGVCNGYAMAYQLLLDQVGIENDLEYGSNHVWNMAKLENEWVHIDVTWDDPSGDSLELEENPGRGSENHEFFAVTTEAIRTLGKHECVRGIHTAENPRMSWLYRHGSLDGYMDYMREAVRENLALGNTEFIIAGQEWVDNVQLSLAAEVLRDEVFEVNGTLYSVMMTFAKELNLVRCVVTGAAEPDWTDPVYQWAEDYTTVTARRETREDPSIFQEETVNAAPYVLSPEEGTEGEAGYRSDPFENEAFAVQHVVTRRIPPLDEMETLVLPQDLKVVGPEAFAGLSCQAVLIPEGCTEIGPGAFSGCPHLIYVRIPSDQTAVAEDAFSDCPDVILDRQQEGEASF